MSLTPLMIRRFRTYSPLTLTYGEIGLTSRGALIFIRNIAGPIMPRDLSRDEIPQGLVSRIPSHTFGQLTYLSSPNRRGQSVQTEQSDEGRRKLILLGFKYLL